VIGVQSDAAPAAFRSWQARALLDDETATHAEGLATRVPFELPQQILWEHLDDFVLVSEGEIREATRLMIEHTRNLVEPAGAAPLAALLGDVELADGPTVIVLGGGNIDPLLLTKLVEHGLSVAGRYLAVRIVMDDRPGSLATLTSHVAELGLNVLDVEHHRSGRRLPVGSVEVELTVETRDHDHQHEVLDLLGAAGFRVELVE